MMKKLFALAIIAVVMLYMSAFTVENNQVAIKTNKYNGKTTMYSKGLYFCVPMLDAIKYFDTDTQTGVFATVVKLYSAQNKGIDVQDQNLNMDEYKSAYMISWHITTPMQYYVKYQESGLDGINILTQIKQEANTIISQAVRNNQTVGQFNLLSNILDKPIYLDRLGVSIDNISLLQLIPVVSILKSSSEQTTNVRGTINESQIESAYYMAQAIIVETIVKKAELYKSLESTDEKFYNYYRKLDIYKNKAKSPEDFPAFNKLY